MERKTLTFKEDVDKELAEKWGMDLKDVEATTNYFIKRLKNQMKDPNIIETYLPHLGYVNARQSHLKKMSTFNIKQAPNLQHKYQIVKKLIEDNLDDKLIMKYFAQRPRIFKYYLNLNKNLAELEFAQNQTYE